MPDPIAVDLVGASQTVPFSVDYLRRAIHRTEGNNLPARRVGGRYIIQTRDLAKWIANEGDPS